jgi:hypothetical protein
MDMKKVAQEKMLYALFLDLWYADQGYDGRIEELIDDLKEAKKHSKKTKKSLVEVKALYRELNGSDPKPPTRG